MEQPSSTALPAPAMGLWPRWKIVLLQLIFAYLIALKLWFDLAVTPMGDEAYYWMWGQHLSWSYFDHPPLDGWLQGVVAAIFGWSTFSVRLLTWLSLLGTLWILWLWAKRLAPANPEEWFWHSAVIYLTIPAVALIAGVAFHDHLLLFFVTASLYFFHGFAGEWEEGRRGWRKLFIAAALLGLAVLTKYNGIFLGIGYAVWVLARPKLRPLFLTWQLWLAALIAIAIQAPVFYWNLTENFASFRFHLGGRPNADLSHPHLILIATYLGVLILAMSPVLFASLFRLRWLPPRDDTESRAFGLSLAVFLTGSIAWGIIGAFIPVFFHWNIVAYAALVPIAWRLLGRWGLWPHIAIGLLVYSVGILSYTVTPLRLAGLTDPGAPANYGWPELAAIVDAQQRAHPDSFIAATRYTYAAQLGFQLHNIDVAAFNPVPSQNDYWWDAAAHAGHDAIIVADKAFPIDAARGKFASLEKLMEMPVTRFGRPIWQFQIWLGRTYQNAPG